MKRYRHFKETPAEDLSASQKQRQQTVSAWYIQDEQGRDWYDLQKTFAPHTVKVVLDEKNTVVSISKDASALFPLNGSVVELDSPSPRGRPMTGSGYWTAIRWSNGSTPKQKKPRKP